VKKVVVNILQGSVVTQTIHVRFYLLTYVFSDSAASFVRFLLPPLPCLALCALCTCSLIRCHSFEATIVEFSYVFKVNGSSKTLLPPSTVGPCGCCGGEALRETSLIRHVTH